MLCAAAALVLLGIRFWHNSAASGYADAAMEELYIDSAECRLAPAAFGFGTSASDSSGSVDAPMLVAKKIDGYSYVGYLRFWDVAAVSGQEFCVPVLATYTSDGLLRAAAATSGSPWTGDFQLIGNNYDAVFGLLDSLAPGDSVDFVTADGLVFSYSVGYVGSVRPSTASYDCVLEGSLFVGLTRIYYEYN